MTTPVRSTLYTAVKTRSTLSQRKAIPNHVITWSSDKVYPGFDWGWARVGWVLHDNDNNSDDMYSYKAVPASPRSA